MRNHKINTQREKNITSTDKIQLDMDIKEDLSDIFDLLHIENYCCRDRLSMVKRLNDSTYEDYNM